MSRYQVEAEFVSQAQPTAQQLAELCRLLSVHGGDAFSRSAGWRATVFVAMSPDPADAGFDAGEIMRAANKSAGMPPARMTDIHVYRVGGVPMPPAEGDDDA